MSQTTPTTSFDSASLTESVSAPESYGWSDLRNGSYSSALHGGMCVSEYDLPTNAQEEAREAERERGEEVKREKGAEGGRERDRER